MSWLYERGYGGMTLNMAVNLDMTRLTDWNSDFLTVIFPFLVIGMSCKFLEACCQLCAALVASRHDSKWVLRSIIQELPLITQIFILRGHLKIILYPRNVYKRDIMMGLWWGHFMPVGEVMMEVTDTWEPGRKEFFRNLFQSAGVTPGPCEKWAELGSSPPFCCHQLHHLISEDNITSMIHQHSVVIIQQMFQCKYRMPVA